jgi:hypothetical protein
MVPAIENPFSELVADPRSPVFAVPSWVSLPGFLAPHFAARESMTVEGLPYSIEGALHFSNGGGVYTALALVRLLCLATGGWLPLLLVLASAPSMLHDGVAPAHIIGAIGYIGGSLRGTLNTLSQGVGAGLVRLTVTLDHIVDASTPPADPPGSRVPAGAVRRSRRPRPPRRP